MKSLNDGGPAFPHIQLHEPPEVSNASTVPGMSLRDWFAGMALQGLLANTNKLRINGIEMLYDAAAYQIADAMIIRRGLQSPLPPVAKA